ncbi:hypothetical protein M0805_006391 [Coniferiporia weirii]|nr:hypothetical protein M0805_006391 [Coniferiporia weirii]
MAEVIAYNFTVDDTSPQIVYSPPTITASSLSPDLKDGWNQYFNGSGFNAYPGQVGHNASLHITSMDGASFSIAFKGSGIQIYGLAIDSSFSLALDDEDMSTNLSTTGTLNSTADPTAVLLASLSGLAQQDHVLSITAHTAGAVDDSASLGTMIFDRAVVTVSTGVTDASVTNEMINDMEIQFTGSWTFVNDSTVVPEGDHTCHLSQTSGDQAQYSFQGSSVELGGLTNATSGLFNISLSSDSVSSGVQQQQISSQSLFLTHTTLFYASGLDRNATHTITITNLENKTLGLDNMSITVVSGGESVHSASPSTQTVAISRFSRGEVAAIAVASSLAFLILLSILFLLLCCYRRRKRDLLFEERKLKALSAARARPDSQHRWPMYREHVAHTLPGQGLSSARTVLVGYDQPAPAYQNVTERVRINEEDEETDSGLGHGQEKRGSIVSMLSFDNIPRESVPTTSHMVRPKSLSLSRWSAWFTSSTSPSSTSSRQHMPVMTSVPIVSPRPVRAHPPASVLALTRPGDGQGRRSSDLVREQAFLNLDIPRTSPFQVDFEKHSQPRNREPSDQARASNAATLGAHARDMLVSFLDFASSGTASFRGSSRSRSRRHSGSNKSASHSGNEDKSTASRHAQGSSGPSQSTSTGMWTLSLSVDPPHRQARDSQLVPTTAVDTIHSTRHPFSMVSAEMQVMSQESPTDSLPMSVSEINFNLSMRSEEDEDVAAGRVTRFHLPRHPPLPSTPRSYDFVPIIRPPDFERASHMRQMSAPNLGLSEPRRPYVAQTSFGRRLAQVRAQALESQRPPSQTHSPAATEQPGTRPSSSRTRILPLPFINFGRSASGSQ